MSWKISHKEGQTLKVDNFKPELLLDDQDEFNNTQKHHTMPF